MDNAIFLTCLGADVTDRLQANYDGVQRTARPTKFGSWTVSRSGRNRMAPRLNIGHFFLPAQLAFALFDFAREEFLGAPAAVLRLGCQLK